MTLASCRIVPLALVLFGVAGCLAPNRADDPPVGVDVNYTAKGRPRFTSSGANFNVQLDVSVHPERKIAAGHTWRVEVNAEGTDDAHLSTSDVDTILANSTVGGSGDLMEGKSEWGPLGMITYVGKSAKYLGVVVSVIESDGMEPPHEVCRDIYARTFPNGANVEMLQPIPAFKEACPSESTGHHPVARDPSEFAAESHAMRRNPVNPRLAGRPRFVSTPSSTQAVLDYQQPIVVDGTKQSDTRVVVTLFGASVDGSWNPSPRRIVWPNGGSGAPNPGGPNYIAQEEAVEDASDPTRFTVEFNSGSIDCKAGHATLCLVAYVQEIKQVKHKDVVVESVSSAAWIPIPRGAGSP